MKILYIFAIKSNILEKMENIFKKMEQYNFWKGNLPNLGYERKLYIHKILKYIDNKLIKVLIGQRRVGKSFLLRQIINHLITNLNINPKNIFYINKEYLGFDEIRNANDIEKLFLYYKKKMKVSGKVYIFLDEVQNIENWQNFVNSFSQDYTNEYELFITGSNSKLLSGELATLLSGRYVKFEILPFGFSEYADFKKLPTNKDNFIAYLQTGGLPEMFHFIDNEVKSHYIQSLKDTIILRDIVQRYKIKDIVLLDSLFKYLATNIGNLTSLNNIVKYFKSVQKKTNYETLSTYVAYLKDTFVIHEVERYDLRGKKVLAGVKKYYLNDLAFKNYLFGILPSDIGYNLENIVYLQLLRMGYTVNVGKKDKKEIDFVAQKDNTTRYIQVSYLLSSQKTIEREFGNLASIKDHYEKIVISMDDIKLTNYKGIKHLRPWELV